MVINSDRLPPEGRRVTVRGLQGSDRGQTGVSLPLCVQKYRLASLDATAVSPRLEPNSIHTMRINYLKMIKNVKSQWQMNCTSSQDLKLNRMSRNGIDPGPVSRLGFRESININTFPLLT